MTAKRLFVLACLAAALAMPAVTSAQDADNDGLPDRWETEGHGPLDPGVHRCHPRRADLILVVCLKEGLTRDRAQPQLDRVKDFFGRIPGRNPDGTTGVNVILVWGNPVPASTPVGAEYEVGFPVEWRELAHGVFLGPDPGGGQTWGNWSSTYFDWRTVSHEIGHQLGLDHLPLGSDRFSPFYTSIMNYDYQGGFGGDPDAVRFSQGELASLNLRETALPEELPVPAALLGFLAHDPYDFKIESRGPRTMWIDWNRNGILGERSVRADINDGSSVHIGSLTNTTPVAGAPALAVLQNRLIAIYPEAAAGAAVAFTGRGLTRETPGRLSYFLSAGEGFTASRSFLPTEVVGEVSATTAFDRLFTAFPTRTGWFLEARRIADADRLVWAAVRGEATTERLTPTLVAIEGRRVSLGPPGGGPVGRERGPSIEVPGALLVFLWNEETRIVSYREVTYDAARSTISLGEAKILRMGAAASAPAVRSDVPVGAIYDVRNRRLLLAATATRDGALGRLRILTLGRAESGWYGETEEWVGGPSGWESTYARPSLVADRETGELKVYFTIRFGERNPDPTLPGQVILARRTGDRTLRDGWRSRFMIDVWNTSHSAPAAVAWGEEIAFAFRWFDTRPEEANRLHLHARASGIDAEPYGDYDDVTHIFTRGLRDSLPRR